MMPPKVGAPPAPPAYTPLQFENLTVSEAPLLKIYYWECCDIETLNAKLRGAEPIIEHTMCLPNAHFNSHPVKLVFWVRHCGAGPLHLQIKRIKNCDCKLRKTRVGFNQYRQLYNCPHRPLVNITQESLRLQPDELVAVKLTCNFYLYGQHRLSYQIMASDGRLVRLHFLVDIGFTPEKCILTRELLPVDAKEYRRFVQPIWVRNPTLKPRKFLFGSYEPGLMGINPIMSVPGQSVWPLLVKYRPTDATTEFELVFQQRGIRAGVPIKGAAMLCPVVREVAVPLLDLPCADQPYVIYPNKLDVTMALKHYHSELICVHNFDIKCIEFRWQLYEVETMFKVACEPKTFRLKPKHTTFCTVHIRSRVNPLHFTRIPIILEVHRVLEHNVQLARQHLGDIESIDDPLWDMQVLPPALADRQSARRSNITIFEQLFWEYLQASTHMRDVPQSEMLRDDLSDSEVLALHLAKREKTDLTAYSCDSSVEEERDKQELSKCGMLKMMGQMLADVLREVSRKWTFIPPHYDNQTSREPSDEQ